MSLFILILLIVIIMFSFVSIFYKNQVFNKLEPSLKRNLVTGCEMARFVLDQSNYTHVSINPVRETSDSYDSPKSTECISLSQSVYEGRDNISIIKATRKALIKTQLPFLCFLDDIKDKFSFSMKIIIFIGWIGLILGKLIPAFKFLLILGSGIFIFFFIASLLDFFIKKEISKRTMLLLKKSKYFDLNVLEEIKKVIDVLDISSFSFVLECPISVIKNTKQFLLKKKG